MIVVYIIIILIAVLVLYIVFLAICAVVIDPKREYETDSRFYRFLINSAALCILKIVRIQVQTSGLEKIPNDTKPVFVCNHRSNFDPIITWYILRKWEPAFISKDANFKIPFYGRFIRKCCFMPIDRENPRKALKTINKAAELVKRSEVAIAVYPEGTRSKNGELQPFHNSVFKIAQKAGAPIVVLSISGTEAIHKNYPFHASHVFLDVIDVLPADEIQDMKTAAIGERVYASIDHRRQTIGK